VQGYGKCVDQNGSIKKTAFIGVPCLLMVVGLEEVMDISSPFMITFALTLHGETIDLADY
jgi:hypothetical protein